MYPQISQPFDSSSRLKLPFGEYPLVSIARLFDQTRQIQNALCDVPVVGMGYSWLRQFIPYAGAANLARRNCAFVGLGRSSFAYPDAPRDIILNGVMDEKKCCVTCSMCSELLRDQGKAGCVVRDAKVYAPIYEETAKEAAARRAEAKRAREAAAQ
jgi:hypothetical protein